MRILTTLGVLAGGFFMSPPPKSVVLALLWLGGKPTGKLAVTHKFGGIRPVSQHLTSIRRPTPWREFADAIDLVIGDTLENPGEPSFWIDAVHAGGFDQRVGDGGGLAATFRTHEQVIFSSESQGSD